MTGSLLVHPHERPPGRWPVLAAELFRERMLSSESPFPCIFGADAARRATLRFAFIPAGDERVPTLAGALREFASVAEELGRRTSLVTIFEFDPRLNSLEAHRDHFWWLLTQLRRRDTAPWPDGISTDPDDPTWEFAFHGMPMFVVANTPHHRRRRSRYFEYFAITFQPRFVFDDLKEGTPSGDNSRTVIRRRLAAYDGVERTPLLASFGAAGTKEWIQYFLRDDNEPVDPDARCPITAPHTRRDKEHHAIAFVHERTAGPVGREDHHLPSPAGELRGPA